MRTTWRRITTLALVAVLAGGTGGCLAAAAGAGAAAGIYLTDQGASGIVRGSLADVDRRTQAVLNELGITVEERTEKQGGFEYSGSSGDLTVRVDLQAQGAGTTEVKASARRNPVDYDRSYARSLIERIVARS
jgi:hypothetical protein